ncbi:FAD-binding domain protein [Fusarium beomiforme]|uniref:FAD-binding domain protein n=1 Tax=Fusarium beomiforme TaxID=44412 RepID=A0A9P5A6D0_9HYPO|nr:FAD-binding domain protein [Fusarium beomiforme]
MRRNFRSIPRLPKCAFISKHRCVNELVHKLPDGVIEPGQAQYRTVQESYWSGTQKDLAPRCFVQPRNAKEVAETVTSCVKAGVAFGVKSGGHGHFAGQSCLHGGIQIDLVKLDGIKINEDIGTVTVGTGCTWRSIYKKLEPLGLMVVGGRSADVGVGGFTLGGGISFYAGERGWAVDNVRSFEVVLANGSIVTATRENEPRLFKALRGGGSNFGIVTAFGLESFPYDRIWGAQTTVDPTYRDQAIEAYADFNSKLRTDPKGHTILIFNHLYGEVEVLQYIVYTAPIPNRPIFDSLLKVPKLKSRLEITDYSDLAAEIADLQGGHGHRHAVSTMTVQLDVDILKFAFQQFNQESARMSKYAFGCLEFHAVPRSRNPADNAYNLPEDNKPLIVLMIAFGSPYRRYDYDVIHAQQCIIEKIKAEAKSRGLYHPFLFANYAGPFQDVLGSYGEQSLTALSEAANQYDPDHVFQNLQPGSFKLGVRGQSSKM